MAITTELGTFPMEYKIQTVNGIPKIAENE